MLRTSDCRRDAERRGRRGEFFATLILMLKDYRILGRRIRTHVGEIDLIARSLSGTLCFVEVKVRGLDEEAVKDYCVDARGDGVRRLSRAWHQAKQEGK